jgi:predicted TPR repeat methyltransferase
VRQGAQPRRQAFDAAYFKRFYGHARTRVVSQAEMTARAALIAAILRHAQVPVRRILDAGCGLGLMRKALQIHLPRAHYTGLESSDYLCDRYGWIQGSVADFRPRRPYDLVICYDVLQYLDDHAAQRALDNFTRLSRAALYVSALTILDAKENCDRSRTDLAVRLRSGAWYRRRLQRRFTHLGFGVWLKKSQTAILWEMEQ